MGDTTPTDSRFPAQPGKSQRRPATNSSSQLIEYIGLPTLSCSRRLCPGWSHHTPQAIRPQPGTSAPTILLPVTNAIERLNGEIKRRAEVVCIFPNEAAIVSSLAQFF